MTLDEYKTKLERVLVEIQMLKQNKYLGYQIRVKDLEKLAGRLTATIREMENE